MKSLRFFYVSLIFTFSCAVFNPADDTPDVKNVIFLVGDGMGFSHICAARYSSVGPDSALNMDKMPVTGLLNTVAADRLITDSAASATAMATGYKTNNGMIGKTPDKQSWTTILMACRDHGLATGLVATSAVTHATPAAFAANVDHRGQQDVIAEHLLKNRVNVILGGGTSYFIPKSENNSKRNDDKNLIQIARDSGYTVVESADSMQAVQAEYLLGLFADNGMTTVAPEPTLAAMGRTAIKNLSQNENGFFLMIEGSQIDWASHDNNFENAKRQTILFDLAVKEALMYAKEDGRTLVVVTADHETGGLSVTGGSRDGDTLAVHWSSGGHTAGMVPLYAYGPGAEEFTGTLDNTDIGVLFAKLLNIKDFPKKL